MFQILDKVSCGNLTGIPSKLPELTHDIFLMIEIAVPVLLVILGTIDLFKGITANKEDEMAKGRKMFVKRLIIGAAVFFIVAIVKLVINFLDNSTNSGNIISCMNCFLNAGSDCRPSEFEYLDCYLNGYNFQLRNDGLIPAASVSGNDIPIDVIDADDSLFNRYNSDKCPSYKEYEGIAEEKDGYWYFKIVRRPNSDIVSSWTCTLSTYTYTMYMDGTVYYGGTGDGKIFSEYNSGFKPTEKNQCPSKDEWTVSIKAADKPSTYSFNIVKKTESNNSNTVSNNKNDSNYNKEEIRKVLD